MVGSNNEVRASHCTDRQSFSAEEGSLNSPRQTCLWGRPVFTERKITVFRYYLQVPYRDLFRLKEISHFVV